MASGAARAGPSVAAIVETLDRALSIGEKKGENAAAAAAGVVVVSILYRPTYDIWRTTAVLR